MLVNLVPLRATPYRYPNSRRRGTPMTPACCTLRLCRSMLRTERLIP